MAIVGEKNSINISIVDPKDIILPPFAQEVGNNKTSSESSTSKWNSVQISWAGFFRIKSGTVKTYSIWNQQVSLLFPKYENLLKDDKNSTKKYLKLEKK